MVIDRRLTVEEICNKLRPIFGKKIDEIYYQYTVAAEREEREEIEHVLNTLYQKHLSQLLEKAVLLEPPLPEQMDGDYNLGTISYAKKELYPFNLRERDWQRHVCITGMSGSGKTTFAFKIIEQLNNHKKNFLVFDWKKSFRPLLKEIPNLMHFTVGDEKVSNLFKTNINRPPKGVSPKEWINVLADLLTESFQASFGVHKVILETLDKTFKDWGVYKGSENYPTWNHIKFRLEEKLENLQGREAGWMESALRIATVLTFGEFAKTLNYKGKNAFTVEDLLNKKVIMELNALGNVEKKFFCEFILTYIYKLKKARQNDTIQNFDHAIIVDEAHNIFLKKPTNFSNESVTDMIYREMREYGTSLICLDQHISKISDTVKGNSACHVAFQQQLPADIEDISSLMQLREKKHFFSSLPVGQAIVKLSERYNQPFLIKVPYVSSRENKVKNEDIRGRMQSLMLNQDFEKKIDPEFNKKIESTKEKESIPHPKEIEDNPKEETPKKENEKRNNDLTEIQNTMYDFVVDHIKAGIDLEEIEKTLERSREQGGYTDKDIIKVINKVFNDQLNKDLHQKDLAEEHGLNKDQEEFINFLQKNQNHQLSTVELYKKIGFSPRKGTKIKKELEQKGLIKTEEVKNEKGWKKFIRLNN